MTSSSFTRLATVTASTKRATLTGGKSSGFAASLSGVACLPLMTVDAETRQRETLKTFHELKDTYVGTGLDIAEGDVLTVAAVDYPIRVVEEWPWGDGSTFLRLIVEVLKR
jgi:hypothetical protein